MNVQAIHAKTVVNARTELMSTLASANPVTMETSARTSAGLVGANYFWQVAGPSGATSINLKDTVPYSTVRYIYILKY